MNVESNPGRNRVFSPAADGGASGSSRTPNDDKPCDDSAILSSRLFQEIAQAQEDMVVVADLQRRLVYLNPAGRRLLGIATDAPIEDIRLNQIHPEWAGRQICDVAIPQALATGRWSGESTVFIAGGREIACRQTLLVHRDAEGRARFMSSTIRDLTEQCRQPSAQQRLHDQVAQQIESERQRLFALLNMLPGFVVLKDRRYRVHYASQGYLDAFGQPDLGPCHQVQFGDAEPCEDCPLQRVLGTRQPVDWERQLPDGRCFHIWAFPYVDENEEDLMLELAVDVTPRKQLEQLVSQASETERRLIGRDLHDALGQSLCGLGFLIGSLAQRVRSAMPDQAATADLIVSTIGQAVSHVRTLAQGLDPVGLQDDGLASALGELAATCRDAGIDCRFTCDDTMPVSDFDATHLYRIAQEAVSNAVLHSSAARIELSLAKIDSAAVLTVSDDGEGFDFESGSSKGQGLRVMRYRCEAVGAALVVDSRPGDGTRITCRMPLKNEGEGQ